MERHYNTWILSNLRVIEETGILTRITMECPLDKINNVSYSQNIWGRLFGFGNVVIQTAAQHGATIYYNVEHPQLLKGNDHDNAGRMPKIWLEGTDAGYGEYHFS